MNSQNDISDTDRPAKLSGTERKRRGHLPRSNAIADLFKVLKAVAADPDVKDADFRLAFRIAQAVDQKTGWAEISDARLIDEICANEQKVRRSRRRLEDAGWLHTQEGKRGRPTRYLFLEQKVPTIHAQLKKAEDAREEAFVLAQTQKRTAAAAAALGVRIHRETGEVLEPIGREISPPNCESNPYKAGSVSPTEFTPLLPKTSTSGLSVKDGSQGARALEPADVRAGWSPYCLWCGQLAKFWATEAEEALCSYHAVLVDDDETLEPLSASVEGAA